MSHDTRAFPGCAAKQVETGYVELGLVHPLHPAVSKRCDYLASTAWAG